MDDLTHLCACFAYLSAVNSNNTPGVALRSTGENGTLWYNRIKLGLILTAGGLLIVNR